MLEKYSQVIENSCFQMRNINIQILNKYIVYKSKSDSVSYLIISLQNRLLYT